MTLRDMCVLLNWQGGTHTQVAQEINRLKNLEEAVTSLMSDLAFQSANGRLKIHKLTEPKLYAVSKLLGKCP